MAGFVTELAVTDNQAVHAGDLLLRLDDRTYAAALAKAEAAVDRARATLTDIDATHRLQEANIAASSAEGRRSRCRDRSGA